MTDKELRHMSRGELLQMLITQIEENNALQEQLEQAEAQLQDRQIAAEQAGSLAEAALSLNGIFQAAQAAADQYLENIQRMNSEQEDVCRQIQAGAEKKAEKIVQEAEEYRRKAHEEADEYWKKVIARAEMLLQNQDALRELVRSPERNQGQ